MSVFQAIKSAMQGIGIGADNDEDKGTKTPEEEARLAAAALAFHVIAVDGVIEESERETLKEALARTYALNAEDTAALVDAARERDLESFDLYGFTSVLNRHLDDEGRLQVVEMLWQMVYADGEVHEFEDNVLWRIAELLHVPGRERIRMKQTRS